MTNKRISAAQALEIGLITDIQDDDALQAAATMVAAQLANAATAALGRTRNLLMSSFNTSLEEQMEREARAIADGGRGPEGREGIAAFLAKRRPIFMG